MIFQADAALIPFADRTFHCVVTSPPYWGLRKYAGEQGRIWGGNKDCVHEWDEERLKTGPKKWDTATGQVYPNQTTELNISQGQFCQLCGAWYGSLGLEPTPELHIQHIVEIFREVKRVLRDDGVVWLNYGDCYAGSGGENTNYGLRKEGSIRKTCHSEDGTRSGLWRRNPRKEKIQQGNLMLMPHRVAIALQDDGWIVRNDLIWFKRNPMPESCAGWRFENGRLRKGSWRHTRAHEYIFMLTKKMQYWCNQEAVREAFHDTIDMQWQGSYEEDGSIIHAESRAGVQRTKRYPKASGRNPRSVLDVPTSPYKGAHYATFPPNLIAPLIRASCPRRACPECGKGWSPVVEPSERYKKWLGKGYHDHSKDLEGGRAQGAVRQAEMQKYGINTAEYLVKSYRPTCECGHDEYVPGIILDPFIGSGTTGAVARELQRRWVGLDISMEYLDQQAKVRALKLTPSRALEGLPLFEEMNSDLE